jgi:glycosyltransferase involved in cell wall biosynthesis
LPGSREAIDSLDAATRIVALQDEAPHSLEPRWRRKCDVIYQSALPLTPATAKPRDSLDVVVVGHLRAEKDPATVFGAMERMPAAMPVRVRHIGDALDAELGRAAHALEVKDSRYRFLGGLPHGLARSAIKRAHVLLHPSILEGGANVIAEALTSGTPVVASRMAGNVGMLGRDYPGYFPVGDASALAACLVRCWEDRTFAASLRKASRARSRLFQPRAEAEAVRRLVSRLLG